MKGKILLGLTAILMLTGAAVPVKADDVWKFDAQRFVLKEYTGTETDVVVPDTMDEGVPVKRLGTQLLAGSETLTSVVVPDSVTILDVGALSYDNNLSEITLSSNLINIGWNAISSNDALTELTIPASVCIIDSYAVSGCYALKKIVFEGACPLIGPEAFVMLSDDVVIYVPDDQIEEYKKVFEENNKNLNIQPSGKPAVLYSAEDYLDTENLTFDAETGSITGYNGMNTRLTIPESIDGVPVKAIGKRALWEDPLLGYVTLPEGLEYVGEDAFSITDTLKYVEFPSTLKTIDKKGFSSYRGFRLDLPDSLEYIGEEAFSYFSVETDLIIPEGVKELGPGAFSMASRLQRVFLPASLEKIGDNCFRNSPITYVYMEGLELPEISDTAFDKCEYLRDIDLNEKCNFCKNLETVWCKNQVDRIGIQTFGVTPMERLCVNAKNIDMSAFAGMESLKEIHIRGGVEHISLGAFAMLPSIETICLEGIDPDVMEDDWANLGNSNLTILVPEDTSDEQLEAIGRKFLSSMIITDGVQVKRGTCSMPEDPMPDIAEMLSAYGI